MEILLVNKKGDLSISNTFFNGKAAQICLLYPQIVMMQQSRICVKRIKIFLKVVCVFKFFELILKHFFVLSVALKTLTFGASYTGVCTPCSAILLRSRAH